MAGGPSDSAALLADSLFNNKLTESTLTSTAPAPSNDNAIEKAIVSTLQPQRRGKRDKRTRVEANPIRLDPTVGVAGISIGTDERIPMEIAPPQENDLMACQPQRASHLVRRPRLKAQDTAHELPKQRNKDKSGEHDLIQPSSSTPRRTLPPSAATLYHRIPARVNKHYSCEATLGQALFVLAKHGWLDEHSDETTIDVLHVDDGDDEVSSMKQALAGVSPEFEATITMTEKLKDVDFSSLLDEDLNYAAQTEINRHTVYLMTACLVHYNMDYGLVLRYLGGEFTAEWRNVSAVLKAVSPYVTSEDLVHIARILDARDASPFELSMYESDDNKEAFLRHGNGRSVRENMPDVVKTLVKEVRNHHLMTFMRWTVRASPNGHHVPQEYIAPKKPVNPDAPPKKGRFVWNGTLKWTASLITMNEASTTKNEAPITFGLVYIAFLTWIWNLRISFPKQDILLAYIDISSCFRYPRIFADLVGAFGFVVGPWYFAANAMVFGSITSASSWEPLRRAISAIAMACFARKWLQNRHKLYLDMVTWEDIPADDVVFVQATKCKQHQGILDENGDELPTPHNIYVDDDLIADTRKRMPQALASAIEAIFTVMGAPCIRLRACAIALDKWSKLKVSYCVVLLGLEFNTRAMTVGITDEYRAEVLHLLKNTWHPGRRSFTVSEMEKLVGKLGRIGQAYRPIFHLMPHMYGSVAYALRKNQFFLAAHSRRFREMLKQVKMEATTEDDLREINYAQKNLAKMTHGEEIEYRMPPSLIEEIRIITALLEDRTILLASPIAHIVPRDGNYYAAADACKSAGGGWSADLSFWWHLEWPEDIQRRARLPNNKGSDMVSINVLEMICVVINFAAAIHVCWLDGIDLDAFPVLANDCDNTAAVSWCNVNCKTSMLGRELGKVFVGLLMGTKLGIQAEWISTKMNVIADDISRIHGKDGVYDYSQLISNYPVLSDCRQFQPSDILLETIYELLRKNASPCPLTVAKLTPSALGSIISLDS